MVRAVHTECAKCGGPKEILQVVVKGVTKTRSMCRPCHSASSYASRKKRTKAYNAAIRDKSQSDINTRAYLMWSRARGRAKKYGCEFSISREEVEVMLQNGHCQATGIRFDLTYSSDKLNPFAPSLDKIDPKQGYTSSNTRLVCWIYNRAKGDGSDADVMQLVEALYAVKNSQTA